MLPGRRGSIRRAGSLAAFAPRWYADGHRVPAFARFRAGWRWRLFSGSGAARAQSGSWSPASRAGSPPAGSRRAGCHAARARSSRRRSLPAGSSPPLGAPRGSSSRISRRCGRCTTISTGPRRASPGRPFSAATGRRLRSSRRRRASACWPMRCSSGPVSRRTSGSRQASFPSASCRCWTWRRLQPLLPPPIAPDARRCCFSQAWRRSATA